MIYSAISSLGYKYMPPLVVLDLIQDIHLYREQDIHLYREMQKNLFLLQCFGLCTPTQGLYLVWPVIFGYEMLLLNHFDV